jgi:hypothetical protein
MNQDTDMARSNELLATSCEQDDATPMCFILKAENELLQNNHKEATKTLIHAW